MKTCQQDKVSKSTSTLMGVNLLCWGDTGDETNVQGSRSGIWRREEQGSKTPQVGALQ